MTPLRTVALSYGLRSPVARPAVTVQLVSHTAPQPDRPGSIQLKTTGRNSVMMRATTQVSVEELNGLCMASLQTLGYTRDEASVLTEVRE